MLNLIPALASSAEMKRPSGEGHLPDIPSGLGNKTIDKTSGGTESSLHIKFRSKNDTAGEIL